MAKQNSDFWEKAVDARQALIELYGQDPSVTLIDIGYPPAACKDADQVVLRVHVTAELTDFQAEVDGIPVCVICEDD